MLLKTKYNLKQLKKNNFYLFIVITILTFFYFDTLIDKPPMGIHQWRQTDCLVITRNYMKGTPFFEPEMDILLADNYTSGKTAGEFPLLYYINGKIWNLIGENVLSYRLLYALISFVCLYLFYKGMYIILQNKFYASIMTLTLYTSPVFVFYSISFLTDTPAFCFSIMASYFLLKYFDGRKMKMFYVSMVLFSLAGLLKVSSLIPFAFFGFILFIEQVFNVSTIYNRKLFKGIWKEWAGMIGVVLIIVAWYIYAEHYNTIHHFKYTFNAPYPAWHITKEEVPDLIERIKNLMSPIFHSRIIWLGMCFLFIFNLFQRKKLPLIAYLSNIIIPIGGLIYFILWLPLFANHDYYYTPFLNVMLGILIPFLIYLKNNLNTRTIYVILSIITIYNAIYAINVTDLRKVSQSGDYKIIGNELFVKFMQWSNWDKSVNWDRFKNIETTFQQLGISKSDKIITLPDPSFSISLYYANRKGWTNFENYNNSNQIEMLKQKGAKYLLILDEKFLSKDFIKPFTTHKIGNHNGILIYKL